MGIKDNETGSRYKRRWYQFSLRSLIGLMVLASIGMSWFAVKMRQASRQREAVAGIRQAGGFVAYDFEWDGSGNRVPSAEPWAPVWLRQLLGDDFLSDVVAAHVDSDEGLELLKSFGHLRDFTSTGWETTNSGLVTVLYVKSRITDAGLEHLRSLSHLQRLDVFGSRVTDAGVARLESLPQLNALDLGSTLITDAGLEHVGRMKQLRQLGLSHAEITDTGLEQLEGLTQLQRLDLRGTLWITSRGMEKLQQAIPNCKIQR